MILSATLQAGGALFLFLPEWQRLDESIDLDSERWSSGQQPHSVPHFMHWFKQTVACQKIVVYQEHSSEIILPNLNSVNWRIPAAAVQQQRAVLTQIAQHRWRFIIIGASWARKICFAWSINSATVTNNKHFNYCGKQKAVATVAEFALPQKLNFIAPDELLQKIQQKQLDNHTF